MNSDRKPAAFPVTPPIPETRRKPSPSEQPATPRAPRALPRDTMPVATPAGTDFFEEEASLPVPAAPAEPTKSGRSLVALVFLGAGGLILSLAVGLWLDQLIRDLFARAEWLGWTAAAATALAAAALSVILVRELLALRRLASVADLQRRALAAVSGNDQRAARAIVADLVSFTASKPQTAAGRRILADTEGEVVDGSDLLRLAETEILGPLDAEARRLVLDAGKRVSVVTAVSPRAAVDLLYVIFEAGRLIRRLSELYGGRPGTLGFFRLARSVLAHLAVTGSIAAGDSLVQQLVGHGLAARLSAKLGEGVVNGAMTVRIGIAAMETARPLPFSAIKRPGLGDFLAALTRFAETKAKP